MVGRETGSTDTAPGRQVKLPGTVVAIASVDVRLSPTFAEDHCLSLLSELTEVNVIHVQYRDRSRFRSRLTELRDVRTLDRNLGHRSRPVRLRVRLAYCELRPEWKETSKKENEPGQEVQTPEPV